MTDSVLLGSLGGEELVDLEGAELRLESRLGFKWMREVDEWMNRWMNRWLGERMCDNERVGEEEEGREPVLVR